MEDLSLNLVAVEVQTCCFQSRLHCRVASFTLTTPDSSMKALSFQCSYSPGTYTEKVCDFRFIGPIELRSSSLPIMPLKLTGSIWPIRTILVNVTYRHVRRS